MKGWQFSMIELLTLVIAAIAIASAVGYCLGNNPPATTAVQSAK